MGTVDLFGLVDRFGQRSTPNASKSLLTIRMGVLTVKKIVSREDAALKDPDIKLVFREGSTRLNGCFGNCERFGARAL